MTPLIFLIGIGFLMLGFVLAGFILKLPIFLWFGAFLALIWGILMYLNTTFLDPVNYIWIIIGVALFIAFVLMTSTVKDKEKVEAKSDLPEDLQEAQLENDQVRKQFQSMRFNRHKVKRNRYNGLANE